MSNSLRIFILFSLFIFIISCSKEISTTQPTEAGTCKIVVDSNPQGAEIFLNNENTGLVTPDSMIDLDAGIYEVILKMDLFLDTAFTVELTENEREVIYVDYYLHPRNFGTIVCNSEPAGASIYLNDSSTGLNTPQTIQFLWPGNYKIKLTYPEHRADSTSILLHANETKNAEFILQDTSLWVDYNSNNSGFPGNYWADCIAVDNNNIKWIGTRDKGLVRYDENEWSTFNMQNSDIPSNWITKIKVDKQNKKWVCTYGGLAIFDDNYWITYTIDNSEIPCNEINAIAFDTQQNVWIGSEARHKLFKYDGSEWTLYPDISQLGNFESEIYSLEIDSQDRVWIGTKAGLIIFDGQNWINYATEFSEFNQHGISSIIKDKNNLIWLGAGGATIDYYTAGGLFFYDGNEFNEIEVPEIGILDIYIDENETKWISCGNRILSNNYNYGGLIKVTTQNQASLLLPNSPVLTDRRFLGCIRDKNSNIWIVTRYLGVLKFKVWKL